MKKTVSILLSIYLIISMFIFSVEASQDLPESEHNYTENFYGEWKYTHPQEAEGLFVYFSQDTKTEEGDIYNVVFDTTEEITISEILTEGANYKVGDYISIFNGDDNLLGIYQGESLSNGIVYVPGSSVKITLTTDSLINDYGFKVEKITTEIPNEMYKVNYHLPNGHTETYFSYSVSENVQEYAYKIIDGEAIIGLTCNGTDYPYLSNGGNEFEDGNFVSDSKIIDLYTYTTPVQLNPRDVYSFGNEYANFDVDGSGTYYMTKEDYIRLVTSACVVHGVGPTALLGLFIAGTFTTYIYRPWNGSCRGFTTTVCLQKKGILDVVGTQQGATCMSDLEPTAELVSLINYYNAQSATSILVTNKALLTYPEEYSRQLKSMCESAEQGNLVLFEFFLGAETIEGYHGYAISGAYTDTDGNHVLLYYDDNYPEYATRGVCKRMTVAPDYSCIYEMSDSSIGFVWTDEFEIYESLDINKTIGNPYIYRFELYKIIIKIVIEYFNAYFSCN